MLNMKCMYKIYRMGAGWGPKIVLLEITGEVNYRGLNGMNRLELLVCYFVAALS